MGFIATLNFGPRSDLLMVFGALSAQRTISLPACDCRRGSLTTDHLAGIGGGGSVSGRTRGRGVGGSQLNHG